MVWDIAEILFLHKLCRDSNLGSVLFSLNQSFLFDLLKQISSCFKAEWLICIKFYLKFQKI